MDRPQMKPGVGKGIQAQGFHAQGFRALDTKGVVRQTCRELNGSPSELIGEEFIVRDRVILMCLLALTLTTQAWAQAGGTSGGGSVWGKITDESGAVLPGVTVTVEGRPADGSSNGRQQRAGNLPVPVAPAR